MASKAELYLELAAKTTERIKKEWPSFLDTAARMYKYPFQDQLLIYAQKPDATACASIELWNNVMNRRIKRGSCGIALLDSNENQPRLRYVFDVSDTEQGHGTARSIDLWNLRQEHDEPVLKSLAGAYGRSGDDLIDAIDRISRKPVSNSGLYQLNN